MGQKVSKRFGSLINASADGDIKELKAAIKSGADVNGTIGLEYLKHCRRARLRYIDAEDTPLHIAISFDGNIECVRMLIQAGADVNKVNAGRGTPLYVAVRANNIACVKLLIEAGADVNILSDGNASPLYYAGKQNSIECMRLLIKAGADVNGDVVLENQKHERKAKHTYAADTPQHVTSYSDNIPCVRLLTEAGTDVYTGHPTPLHIAVAHNSVECVKILIEEGADVNAMTPGYVTPLCVAVKWNNIECMKMLTEAGADVNSEYPKGISPLSIAIKNVSDECSEMVSHAQYVKIAKDDVNGSDFLPWITVPSSLDNIIRCLQLLLSKGAHVNQPDVSWGVALESFLSVHEESKNAMKAVITIMAAGVDGVGYVRIKQEQFNLKRKCQEAIRRHLLSINNINLFVRVPQLPLPAALKSYLLYDVTLDEDYLNNDVMVDVDIICNNTDIDHL